MRKKMPTITESAAELVRRMQDEPDGKKRQRLHAFYLVASGQARHRQEVAALVVRRIPLGGWSRPSGTPFPSRRGRAASRTRPSRPSKPNCRPPPAFPAMGTSGPG